MTIEEHIELFKRIDGLIRRKNTGSPKELAEKTMLSERQIHRLIRILKTFCPIEFSKAKNSYYYYNSGRLRVMEFISDETELELKKNGQYNQATK
jgi:predicted DNA-binding transcriptional regulator YafY